MAINKIIYGGETLIDLTGDTVSQATLLSGTTAHDKSGAIIKGNCTFDVDSQDATVSEAEILRGKTAYARRVKLTGTMPNNGSVNLEILSREQKCAIPQGYHDGSGKVGIAEEEIAKITPENIRQGIAILGVEGNMSGSEDVKAQSKAVTPSTSKQTVIPDMGYNYLSEVIVNPIPYVQNENSAGGITVTIG